MKRPSYLLLLDGSEESACAAQICKQLAERTGAFVTALSIIDITSIRNLVRQGRPGVVGSGPHIAAREQLTSALKELAETVQVGYRAKFPSLIEGPASTKIVEGDPAEVVRVFYDSHDLVIMGRRTPAATLPGSLSLSEVVATDGVRPVLIVFSEISECSRLRLVAGDHTPDPRCFEQVLDLAQKAQLTTQLSYFGSSIEFDNWADLLANKIPASSTTVHFTDVKHPLQEWKNQMPATLDSLTVFFTRKNPVGRTSVCDQSVSSLLLDLRVPAALLWPVEFQAA